MLIYKLFLFVLYVLTNYFIVCYNNNVVGNPTEQYRRTFFCKKHLAAFLQKPCFPQKGLLKQKQ